MLQKPFQREELLDSVNRVIELNCVEVTSD
jgi:FixJ family two-component response regulator